MTTASQPATRRERTKAARDAERAAKLFANAAEAMRQRDAARATRAATRNAARQKANRRRNPR